MEGLITLFVTLAFLIVVVLVCREVYCWYTKANERLYVQREMLDQLKAMNRYFDSLGDD